MRRKIVWTTFLFVMLLLSLAAVAAAQERFCSNDSVAGTWGYTETGTLYLPTGAVPYVSVRRYTVDADGNLSGTRIASAGGAITPATTKGTATVHPDCTGTLTLSVYNQLGTLTATAVKAVVYDDNAKEARAIITSAVMGNGTSVPAVLTTKARRLFPVGM